MTSYDELPVGDPLRPLQKFCEVVTYCKTLNMYAHGVNDDSISLGMPATKDVLGDSERQLIHTGALITLIDSACGMAVLHKLKQHESIATLDLRVDFINSATVGEEITCNAQCYRVTRNVVFVRADAHTEDRRLIATAMASFMRLKPPVQKTDEHS